jgi:asparagine synthetase B (glutamine-hydrolysing)
MKHDYFKQKLQQMLRWEDSNGMAHSIESRNPFADDMKLAQWLMISMRKKTANGYAKGLLRKAVADIVPQEVLWRVDKKGFTVPDSRLTWRCREAWKDHFLSKELEPWSPQNFREQVFLSMKQDDHKTLQWFFRLTSLSVYLQHLKRE